MGDAISDKQVVAVLRPFVRAASTLVDGLREADPFGLVANTVREDGENGGTGSDEGVRQRLVTALRSVRVPGNEGWGRMTEAERTSWWVDRVGRFTSLVTAVPGLGGALADRLPVQETLGAASQGLLLCAVAGERGYAEVGDRVRLLAWVLFERDIDPSLAEGRGADHDSAAEDSATEALSEELSASSRRNGRVTLTACATTLWRLGRSLLAITGELEKRPRGRFYHRAIGMLPVVGMVGDYLGERSGLKRVATRAETWFLDVAQGR